MTFRSYNMFLTLPPQKIFVNPPPTKNFWQFVHKMLSLTKLGTVIGQVLLCLFVAKNHTFLVGCVGWVGWLGKIEDKANRVSN